MSAAEGYSDSDRARWAQEARGKQASADRSPFERDRARVLHSAALRRLAAKTQVVTPGESDFPRTRLTHSLECAQIGRELGKALGADPDLVETACLAHDLGHPPFGHTGEEALDAVARACGGFEGNAQSLRILVRLEAKVITESGRSAGLNLTRATLDAATKYPWTAKENSEKFGVYDDDLEIFGWFRLGAGEGRRCFEAQVMDWADDIAYSVHDLEDAIFSGRFVPSVLDAADERAALFALATRYAPGTEEAAFEAALTRLADEPYWPGGYNRSFTAQAALKAATSGLIGRFCNAAVEATREQHGPDPHTRYGADLVVPRDVRIECAVLKAITAQYVMERQDARELRAEQRRIIADLVAELSAQPEAMESAHLAQYRAAGDDAARLRAVVDQVASFTDTSARAVHRRLSS